jgi:GNAT superfamily N-acetyltransferase
MSVEIKKAGIENLKEAVPLFDAYRVFYKQPSDEKAAADFLRDRMINNESVIFLAYVNNVAVGLCQLYPLFSSVGMQRVWLLNDLYVNENARGQGVAAALLQRAKEFGIETNARWVSLETAADNLTAQSIYDKNGWKKSEGVFYEMKLY